jgi:hypothetical protein
MITEDTLWFWQANLGRGVSEAVFRRNFDRVYRRGGAYSAYLLQEVDEADEAKEVDYILDRSHKTHRAVGMKTGAPILVPREIDLIDFDTRLACRGLAKYTPNRYVTEAVVGLKNGTKVGLFNTHVPILRVRTLTRRRDVRQALREETNGQRNGLWVADTNTRRGWPTIVKGEKSAVDAGIDKAKVWAKGEGRVLVKRRDHVDLTIDNHNAHGAQLKWLNAA